MLKTDYRSLITDYCSAMIVLLRILAHHAHGGELGRKGDHRAADALNPLARDALRVALEKEGDDLLGQDFVEVGTIGAVLDFDGIGVGIFADGEAVGAIVTFAPPAVEDAEIEAAVAAGFHAAGARGFEGAARGVQPHV